MKRNPTSSKLEKAKRLGYNQDIYIDEKKIGLLDPDWEIAQSYVVKQSQMMEAVEMTAKVILPDATEVPIFADRHFNESSVWLAPKPSDYSVGPSNLLDTGDIHKLGDPVLEGLQSVTSTYMTKNTEDVGNQIIRSNHPPILFIC